MRYKLLGTSGLRVSELCLGTMTFGDDWGWGADFETSKAVFDRFAEAGGNFIDTASLYTNGTSERFVGDLVKADRGHFVVATKYTLTPAPNQGDTTSIRPNDSGNSRKNMMQTVEASLKRLQTDYIDLLYLHAWDYMTPVEEVMRGLDDLVRMGKVLYIVFSDTPAYIVAEAATLAQQRGWARPLGIQIPYSLIRREVEREILPMALHWGMAVLPWGILNGGLLTGKFLREIKESTRIDPERLNISERAVNIVREVVAIADSIGRSPSQVAINWVRQQQHRAQIIPILGARRLDQLEDNLACLEWTLDDDQMRRLEEVSHYELGFPHDFLPASRFVFGNTYEHIDNHRGTNPIRS